MSIICANRLSISSSLEPSTARLGGGVVSGCVGVVLDFLLSSTSKTQFSDVNKKQLKGLNLSTSTAKMSHTKKSLSTVHNRDAVKTILQSVG